jgi:type IV secretory pathway component VirB8
MTGASRENGSKEQMLIYIIAGVASVIIFIMVLLIIMPIKKCVEIHNHDSWR